MTEKGEPGVRARNPQGWDRRSCHHDEMVPFADSCVASPAGVALLAALEARERDDVRWFHAPPDSRPDAVAAAVRSVASMSFGDLCHVAVDAGDSLAGPWTSGAPANVASCYQHAEARYPIAVAVGERFDQELHSPMDANAQQWWTSFGYPPRRLFADFDVVYSKGAFAWNGLWTATRPPPEAHDDLISRWEIYPGPVSRWRIPVVDGARIYEVNRPADWLALALKFPKMYTGPDDGWELPGPNQNQVAGTGLIEIPHQRATVTQSNGRLMPDWAALSRVLDGVHLSWAGFITTEGCIVDVSDGVHTMLRHWGSERTHWLRDAFGEPEPLAAPHLSGRSGGFGGVSTVEDLTRREEDRRLLAAHLGR